MRLDLVEEEYLENERQRRSARPSNISANLADRLPERTRLQTEADKFFKRTFDVQPDSATLVSADQEWVCERCGAEIPPAGRFCAACGFATDSTAGPHILAEMGARVKRWSDAGSDLANRYGLPPVSLIALAVAVFCVAVAVVVQLSIPASSPWFSQVELYQVYAIRSLLWLLGSIGLWLRRLFSNVNLGCFNLLY